MSIFNHCLRDIFNINIDTMVAKNKMSIKYYLVIPVNNLMKGGGRLFCKYSIEFVINCFRYSCPFIHISMVLSYYFHIFRLPPFLREVFNLDNPNI